MDGGEQVWGGAELGDGGAQGEDAALGLVGGHDVRLEVAAERRKPGGRAADLGGGAGQQEGGGGVHELGVALGPAEGAPLELSARAGRGAGGRG